jgi:hypothetical protein
MAYFNVTESISLLEPVLCVFGGDLKKNPTGGIEPKTSRSLGGHHIHYAMVTLINRIFFYQLQQKERYVPIRNF